MSSGKKLLVLDTSYAWEAIVERGLYESVTCRDLDGFFDHVWTVHPFASIVEAKTKKRGAPEVHRPTPNHTFINGKVGRFEALARFPKLNFAIAQASLFVRLARIVKKENVSAIRGGDALLNGLMGLALARLTGIPLLVRVNANYDETHEITGKPIMPRVFRTRRIEKAVYGYVLAHADLVAAVNEDNRSFAIANGARPEHSTVFRYGNLIDKRHLVPPGERAKDWGILKGLLPEGTRFLLAVNRLEPTKLPDHAVKVLAAVRARGQNVKLLMVGDGSMRKELEALARELGVAEHVAFAGNRDQAFLAQVIPMASVVVSPITGRALTEVAFAGAAIVGYDLDWQKEVLITGKTGALLPALDVTKMADAVEQMLLDPAYARRMGDAVREHALDILGPGKLDDHERAQYSALFDRFRALPR